MELNREPIKNWFGFTRRERRSSSILLFIVLTVISFRFIVPGQNIEIEDLTDSILQSGLSDRVNEGDISYTAKRFSFDPNTAPYDTLIRLGFDEKEARTLISFRNKGGRFRKPSDIKKVYGINEGKADSIIPFIEVIQDTVEKKTVKTFFHGKIIIDLNSCDSSSLVRLPGIGPVLSARIIKYRKLLGGYARVDQLREVYGLPEETYNLIQGNLTADTTILTRVKINSAGYKELIRLPYIEKYEITSILKYTELKGRINGINDLVDNKLLTLEKAAKVQPYIDFE